MQREICRVKISYARSSEDHPGAALIKPGRHRYRPNEEVQRHNEGGTAVTDLSSRDIFMQKNRRNSNENHVERRKRKRIRTEYECY